MKTVCLLVWVVGALAAVAAPVAEPPALLAATPRGVVENGVPPFAVIGPEAMDLTAQPTDVHLLPDGRLLVVSRRELAFTDGRTWETFRSVDPTIAIARGTIAVAQDGAIFAAIRGGFARVAFDAAGTWRLQPAAQVPGGAANETTLFREVVELRGEWLWYGDAGLVVSWRPGQQPQVVARMVLDERPFALGETLFITDQTSGRLHGRGAGESEFRPLEQRYSTEAIVTCAVPFRDGEVLVGTIGAGLRRFDGKRFLPFAAGPELQGGRRINDLCVLPGDQFAAAVDGLGLVFFERDGRVQQVVQREQDLRLGRAQQLLHTPNGVLWAMLADGLARVECPSALTAFAPLLPGGISYAKPVRHEGRLWLLSDGRVLRGIYTASGRLQRFEDDTPPGRFQFLLTTCGGALYATNETGIHRRDEQGWVLAGGGPMYARLGFLPPAERGIPYVARDELGWLRPEGNALVAERHEWAGLGDSFGAVVDADGIVWLELGAGRVARADFRGATPAVRIYGVADGLATGWVQVSVIDGAVRLSAPSDRLLRHDPVSDRFVDDTELLQRYPELKAAVGRPMRDASGRLWCSDRGLVHVITDTEEGGRERLTLPVGFTCNEFTMQEDGVVWMWERRRLVRFDPFHAPVPLAPPACLITTVQLTESGRVLPAPGVALAPLDHSDNSLLVRFAAPDNPFAAPPTYEVFLEGADHEWSSLGSSRSTAFHRLDEGQYVLRVRAVREGRRGPEAQLAFTIVTPWYRARTALAGYGVAAVALLLTVARRSTTRQQRERRRLEEMVAERTQELVAAREQAEAGAQAKSQFLANTSHELRTPLNAVLGMCSLLLESPLSREQREFGETIRKAGDSLLEIINGILDYSKIEAGKLELDHQPFALGECLETVLEVVGPKVVNKPVELLHEIAPDVPAMLVGDAGRLRQVLVNLTGNGVKFTERGEVLVRVSLVAPVANGRARLGFSVRDTGIGIPADRRDRLFKSFSQVDSSMTRRYGGTGLGLAISQRLVALMGGRIAVESTEGAGSTFSFELALAVGPESAPAGLDVLAGRRLLVVDDNASQRRILGERLRRWGAEVHGAESGAAAVAWVEANGRVDLAFVDQVMPGWNGVETVNALRGIAPGAALPVVLLCPLGVPAPEPNPPGVVGCLSKPVKTTRLYSTVLTALSGGLAVPAPAVAGAGAPVLPRRLGESRPLAVLVADDNLTNQRVAQLMLAKLGYTADTAEDGFGVIAALERRDYDLVFLDVQMPEMDGLEAARAICRRWPAARRPYLVAVTAHALPGDREQCLAAGMADYVTKPIRPADFERVLQTVLAASGEAPA